MLRKAAMMEGTYPAICPSCKAENLFFGRTIIKRSSAQRMLVDNATGEILHTLGES
jgi:hypothetical protein